MTNCTFLVPVACVKDADCPVNLLADSGSAITVKYSWGEAMPDDVIFYQVGVKQLGKPVTLSGI